jgi:hypothetical protein
MKTPCVERHKEIFNCYNIFSTERVNKVNKMSDKKRLAIDDSGQIDSRD